jgi:oligogalacturonide lyase
VFNGSYVEYPTTYSDGHTQANSTGDIFVGDGSDKEPFINLYRLNNGKLTGRHLWKHESSFSQQYWHPHPRFSPDDKYILFTSCRGGDGNVYLIKLDGAK